MGWKITLTFADAQSSLLHFRRYYPRRLPMAAIFLLRDANCRRWNHRIPCQPFCLKYVLIHSLGKFTTLETKFPTFCSNKRETLAIIQGRDQQKKRSNQLLTHKRRVGDSPGEGFRWRDNYWGRGKLIYWNILTTWIPSNNSGGIFTQSSRSKVNLISSFKYLFSYLFYYLLFLAMSASSNALETLERLLHEFKWFSRETSRWFRSYSNNFLRQDHRSSISRPWKYWTMIILSKLS